MPAMKISKAIIAAGVALTLLSLAGRAAEEPAAPREIEVEYGREGGILAEYDIEVTTIGMIASQTDEGMRMIPVNKVVDTGTVYNALYRRGATLDAASLHLRKVQSAFANGRDVTRLLDERPLNRELSLVFFTGNPNGVVKNRRTALDEFGLLTEMPVMPKKLTLDRPVETRFEVGDMFGLRSVAYVGTETVAGRRTYEIRIRYTAMGTKQPIKIDIENTVCFDPAENVVARVECAKSVVNTRRRENRLQRTRMTLKSAVRAGERQVIDRQIRLMNFKGLLDMTSGREYDLERAAKLVGEIGAEDDDVAATGALIEAAMKNDCAGVRAEKVANRIVAKSLLRFNTSYLMLEPSVVAAEKPVAVMLAPAHADGADFAEKIGPLFVRHEIPLIVLRSPDPFSWPDDAAPAMIVEILARSGYCDNDVLLIGEDDGGGAALDFYAQDKLPGRNVAGIACIDAALGPDLLRMVCFPDTPEARRFDGKSMRLGCRLDTSSGLRAAIEETASALRAAGANINFKVIREKNEYFPFYEMWLSDSLRRHNICRENALTGEKNGLSDCK